MDISKLTIGEAREIASMVGRCGPEGPAYQSPLSVNAEVLIRTVTHYYTGRIVALSATEIVLADAAWIADTGRFSEALAKGTLSEVEPYPDDTTVSVARGAVVDVCRWKHELPRQTK